MECFSTAELGLQILVISWTHLFFTAKVFWGLYKLLETLHNGCLMQKMYWWPCVFIVAAFTLYFLGLTVYQTSNVNTCETIETYGHHHQIIVQML